MRLLPHSTYEDYLKNMGFILLNMLSLYFTYNHFSKLLVYQLITLNTYVASKIIDTLSTHIPKFIITIMFI